MNKKIRRSRACRDQHQQHSARPPDTHHHSIETGWNHQKYKEKKWCCFLSAYSTAAPGYYIAAHREIHSALCAMYTYIYINVHHAPVMAGRCSSSSQPGLECVGVTIHSPSLFSLSFFEYISKQLGARAIHPSIHPAHHYTSAYSNTDLDDYHLMIPPSALLRWNIWKKRIYIVAAGGAAEKQKTADFSLHHFLLFLMAIHIFRDA